MNYEKMLKKHGNTQKEIKQTINKAIDERVTEIEIYSENGLNTIYRHFLGSNNATLYINNSYKIAIKDIKMAEIHNYLDGHKSLNIWVLL